MTAEEAPFIDQLRQSLGRSVRVEWLVECSSTNTVLRTLLAETGRNESACLLGTECQTAGRGTRGREWRQGGAGLDIALSLALRIAALPPGCPALDPRAPLLAAVLVAGALEQSGLRVSLKWPNDLLLGDPPRKAGGLLCEVHGGWLIIGLGLNVNSLPEDFPDLEVTTVRAVLGQSADRIVLTLRLAQALCQLAWLDSCGPLPGPGPLLDEWLRLDATAGARYRLLRGAGIPVLALGVDLASGGLLCRDERGYVYLVHSYLELTSDQLPR